VSLFNTIWAVPCGSPAHPHSRMLRMYVVRTFRTICGSV